MNLYPRHFYGDFYLPNINNDSFFLIAGFLAVVLYALAIFAVVGFVIKYIANWKLFEKANVQGWKCLIPFYNSYKNMQIVFGNSYGWLFLIYLIPVVNAIFILYVSYKKAKVYNGDNAIAIIAIFFPSAVTYIQAFSSRFSYVGPNVNLNNRSYDNNNDYRYYNQQNRYNTNNSNNYQQDYRRNQRYTNQQNYRENNNNRYYQNNQRPPYNNDNYHYQNNTNNNYQQERPTEPLNMAENNREKNYSNPDLNNSNSNNNETDTNIDK